MTVVSLKDELKYRGYDPNQTIIVPSKELVEIADILNHPRLNVKTRYNETLKSTIKSTKSFYKRHFHLERVPYLYEKKGIEYVETVSPFKIPVQQNPFMDEDQCSFSARLNEILLDPPVLNFHIAYRCLELSKDISELTRIAYTHEVAHSELNHIKGIIENYYNTEVISIFLELVHSYEECLLDVHDAARLSNLQGAIEELIIAKSPEETLIEASMYTESTLKAYELFFKYYCGSLNLKKEIMYYVQLLFNQQITLEDLLYHFDISFTSSQQPDRILSYLNGRR